MNPGKTFIMASAMLCCSAVAEAGKSLPIGSSEEVSKEEMAYLVNLCEGCHGPTGHSERPEVPALAGRPADELFAEIERFYFYERVCPDVPVDATDAGKGHMSMCDVTNRMSQQEAKALARYFSAQAK